jgi:sigma-B regulation protein RsbU (phosphoserine phosphatase)
MTAGWAADEAFLKALADDDPLTLYERAPCGYLSTTPEGTIVKVNETFLGWSGYERRDLVGERTFASLLSVGGRIYHDTHLMPMLHLQEQAREIALELVKADGGRLPVLVNATLSRDELGEPVVVRVVVFDATERRRYEQELLRAKERAEASEARARSLAYTLQQTLIPPHPPQIPGLDVRAVYRPAGTGEEVGGDFYDIFQIADDDWVVVLGDVCGKGADAAVVTALVRHTVRAISVRTPDPVAVLEALNEVLLREGSDRFCTVALLRLRRVEDGWRVRMSLGGHPQALVRTPTRASSPLGEPGTLVGAFDGAAFAETQAVREPGTTLVLFTDGVTEARQRDSLYGEARLRTLMDHHDDPAEVSESILADVLDFQGGLARDDIAVVAITVPFSGRAGSPDR